MTKNTKVKKLIVIIVIVALLAAAGGHLLLLKVGPGAANTAKSQTYTVKRDDLVINVTESGDIKAINSEDIKSEVEGRNTIISIVDEGTVITAEDVNNGRMESEIAEFYFENLDETYGFISDFYEKQCK